MSALTILRLAAELPDPGQISFAPIMGAVAFFFSGLVAHLRGLSDEERARWADLGMWGGIGVGLAVWLLGFAIHAL